MTDHADTRTPSELLVAAADRIRDLAAAVREDVGTSVRVARVSGGLALREVARRIDCAPSYLSDIENGHRVPSEAVTRQLATELGLDAERLLVASGRTALVAEPLAPALERLLRDAANDWDWRMKFLAPAGLTLDQDGRQFGGPLALARLLCPAEAGP